MSAGMAGGILGVLIGISGGVVGTYCSIRNTKGPLERALIIKASAFTWFAVLAFVSLMFALPNPYRHLLWIPYGVLLPLGITKLNSKVSVVRNFENST